MILYIYIYCFCDKHGGLLTIVLSNVVADGSIVAAPSIHVALEEAVRKP